MSLTARTYIWLVISAGYGIAAYSAHTWDSANISRFLMYLVITALGSGLKVSLPNVTGTMSVYFLFSLIGIVQLSLGETVVLGFVSTLVQCFWRAHQRPKAIHILFNTASVTVASWAGYQCYHWSMWPTLGLTTAIALGAAAILFFVFNTGLVAVVVALTEEKTLIGVWRDCYFWCFPYYLLGACVAAVYNALSIRVGWEIALLIVPVILVVFRSYKLYLDRLKAEKDQAQRVAALHLRTIEALALAIEAKDQTTHQHLERVKVYALAIGEELNLSPLEMQALEAAALLHDVGKLAVPEHIISKPGKLTPEEFEKMKIHPVVGAEILDRVNFPYPVSSLVLSHHERWDGTGYPYGLAGDAIPIGARILAAVDCLDALASDRQYRRALPLDQAMDMVAQMSGANFDPAVVEILQRRYRELEDSTRQRAATGGGSHASVAPQSDEKPGTSGESSEQPVRTRVAGSTDFLTSIAAARQEAQELFELAKDLGNSLSLNETLWVISARVRRMVPFDALSISLLRDGKLWPEFATGDHATILQTLVSDLGEGLAGQVAGSHQPLLNANPSMEPGYARACGPNPLLRSALSVPLEGMESVVGVLTLYSSEPESFSKDQLRVLLAISSKVAASIENALKYEQARTSATVDFLTGLPNARSLFVHLDGEVARCQRENQPLAVVVCDLDGFKQVNDRFGHLVGNELLKVIAAGLKQSCRQYDCVARMGGDEFVVVMPRVDLETLDQRVHDFDQMVVEVGEKVCGERVVGLSAGCALLNRDGADAESLLAEADRRMYRTKRSRKPSRPTLSKAMLGDPDSLTIH